MTLIDGVERSDTYHRIRNFGALRKRCIELILKLRSYIRSPQASPHEIDERSGCGSTPRKPYNDQYKVLLELKVEDIQASHTFLCKFRVGQFPPEVGIFTIHDHAEKRSFRAVFPTRLDQVNRHLQHQIWLEKERVCVCAISSPYLLPRANISKAVAYWPRHIWTEAFK